MVFFVGVHRPDRKPVFRFSGFSVFRVFRCSGRSAGRVCRTTGDSESRFAAFPVPIPVPIPVSVPVSAAAAGRCCSSGPLRPLMLPARLRVLSAIRTRGASDASLRASAVHLLFRMPSGDRLPIPPRGVACFSPSRRRQRLSPLPEIRWRCMRERSLSTFICATSSSS